VQICKWIQKKFNTSFCLKLAKRILFFAFVWLSLNPIGITPKEFTETLLGNFLVQAQNYTNVIVVL
jgi:hypothetical protein